MIIRRLVAVMLLVAGGAFADDQLVVDRVMDRLEDLSKNYVTIMKK